MTRVKLIIGAVLILPCLALPAAAQDIEFVSSTLHHNPYYSIGKVGEYLYCGGPYGIHIFDITDPSNPELVQICDFPGIDRMFIYGDFIYLISTDYGTPGLRILETLNPLDPQIISYYDMPAAIYGTIYYENTIFTNWEVYDSLGYYYTKIGIIDVSDPYNPVMSDTLTFIFLLSGIWASDGYLHILTSEFDFWFNYWHLLSLTDPAHPNHVHTMDFGYEMFEGITAYQHYAYLKMYPGANIYEFSDPNNPSLVRIDSSGNFPEFITMHDTVGYAKTDNGITTYNMCDPVYPKQISNLNINYGVGSFFYGGDTCFTATVRSWNYDDASKFNIVDFSNIYNPAIIGEHWTPGKSHDVQISGDYAYIANGNSGLTIVDISDPEEPEIIDIIGMAKYAKDIFIQGNRLYLLRSYRFEIYDISVPTQPVLLGYYSDYLGKPRHFYVDGDYAYISKNPNSSPDFILILDISTPAYPVQNSTITDLEYASYIQVEDGYAYIGCFYDMVIYDVSDPDSIAYVSEYPYHNYAYQFEIEYPFIFTACRSRGMEVINISDPANPYFVSEYDSLYTGNITLFENYALLKGYRALYLMDISSPEIPFLVSTYTPADVWLGEEANIRDSYIYVPAYNRFEILRLTPTGIEEVSTLNLGGFSLPQNYPNPFNASTTISYSLPQAADIRIEIYDILGRKLETLFSGPQEAGEHTANWNPGNISSGVYYYRIASEDFNQSRSCLLIK
ncbi:MAG: T9SS type A sorting domain-containing protein [Candidatus Zixiibacteriota bacterium]|nr:MAG: T9SS type A sorting domain-containing protein [candidate division Zixibacteria bacterium]